MVARVFVGAKAGLYGLWASPPGVNAQTADDSLLILQMTNYVDRIILAGYVPSSQTVALGLNTRPIVMLTPRGVRPGFGDSATRPGPMGNDTRSCSAVVTAASLVVTAPQPCMYQVFSRAFP